MNEIINKEINIENMIYEIRGKQVMLDSDLAKLYECKNGTKTLNQAVKRHINKFPERYMFQLKMDEYKNLRSQIGTLEIIGKGQYSKYLPYVFTEQGVAMLATILHTEVADEISMKIIDAFISMRKYLSKNLIDQGYINNIVLEDRERINMIENTLSKFEEKNNHLFFEGQIYDAYSLLLDILSKSNEEIIIIDNYAGKELLDLLKNIDNKIIIVSKNIDDNLRKKYKSQYNNVDFIENNSIHDRFIIIDKKELYISGSSFKDLGKNFFYIDKVEDIEILNNLLSKI